jgi:anti-sigma factor RsiW
MPSETRHFQESLQDLLDERLAAEARPEVERHLESCEECRREFEALRWTTQVARRQFAAESAPAKLEASILAALDREDREDREDRDSRARAAAPRTGWDWRRPWLSVPAYGRALAAGIALALLYFLLRTPSQQPPAPLIASASLPSAVARDFRAYQAGALPLSLQTGEVREMERFFSANGLAFDTRVFDLAMMNYRLAGGRVHQLAGRPSALFVYQGNAGQILLCQMYPGLVTELPPEGAALREHNGIRFYAYRLDGLTAVFWQEGAVTCVLASDIEPEEVIQLAFAKAMKV